MNKKERERIEREQRKSIARAGVPRETFDPCQVDDEYVFQRMVRDDSSDK